eukprot:ctg_174.g114
MGARRGRGADIIHSQPTLNFVAGFLGRSALARWSRVLRRAQVPRSPCRCSRPARSQPLLCSSSLQRVSVSSAARRLPEPESLSYAEYLRLCEEARRHDVLYYKDHPAPEIADEEYDWLVAFIVEAERLHPEWQLSSESPSLRVGGAQPGARFPQAPHLRPLLSLNNTYQWSEVESQAVRISRLATAEHDGEEYSGSVAPFCVEPKIDGVALSLVYEDRQVARAVTRGDVGGARRGLHAAGGVLSLEPGAFDRRTAIALEPTQCSGRRAQAAERKGGRRAAAGLCGVRRLAVCVGEEPV